MPGVFYDTILRDVGGTQISPTFQHQAFLRAQNDLKRAKISSLSPTSA